jgi:hypothetical protein
MDIEENPKRRVEVMSINGIAGILRYTNPNETGVFPFIPFDMIRVFVAKRIATINAVATKTNAIPTIEPWI